MPSKSSKFAKPRMTKTPFFAGAIAQIRKKHPETGMSASTVFLLSSLGDVLTDRLIETAGKLAKYDEKSTMKNSHATTAAKMVLIGGLSTHAAKYASTAMKKFVAA